MILGPQDYLLQQNSINGAAVWCIGFQKIQGQGQGQGMTILGDLVLKDKIIVYDLAGQRIGWANYDLKGMNLVRELEKDLKVANVICMNGRRHLISSRNEVSRDLIVTKSSKKKQALLDMLPVVMELRHALDMQVALETHVEEGNFSKAFQVLSEYLQLLDSLSDLSAVQEMSRGVEVWLGKTLQKLDSLLLGVCQDFKEDGYITVLDAYALIGDVSGLAEKIQSFFMQEVISETQSVLKTIVMEEDHQNVQNSRLTYSDLCIQVPESKFRECLLATLAVLFKLMSSYYAILSFQLVDKVSTPSVEQNQGNLHKFSNDTYQGDQILRYSSNSKKGDNMLSASDDSVQVLSSVQQPDTTSLTSPYTDGSNGFRHVDYSNNERDDGSAASSSGSPWFQLRKDALTLVSQTLRRGRKNLWQLATSRIAVLLSSSAVCSTSTHQFLKNYEDLNIFVLSGEAFCGIEAVEFRQKVKAVCESYFIAFHRQNIHERCTAADTISLVAHLLHRSKTHLQSRLLQHNAAIVEDFYLHLVDATPDLTQHIHRTTTRLLLHINGYVDRIASAKWEVKELGMEHNGYVDLLLGEFKHYKTRLAHGGIHKEVQDLLLEYGVEIIAETLIEGLSRVKRCTDEGRALMSLDLQVLINGLKHFVSIDVRPKLQIVEAFIKAYYLPETEYVHWARAHPEYNKSQIVGLVNLVATMKGWKRKTRLEVLEKIE